MDLLQLLSSLGVPGWAITLAALVFILEKFGITKLILAKLKSQSQLDREQAEFERQQQEAKAAAEQSEQIALWSQMTQFATKSLSQQEVLLSFVLNTHSDWHSKHSEKLDEVVKCQQQMWLELKSLAAKWTEDYGKDKKSAK